MIKKIHLKQRQPRLEVVLTAFRYFAFGRPDKTLLISFIMLATLVKNIVSGVSRFLVDKLGEGSETFNSVLIKILLFQSATIGLNFITDFLFERTLIPYGSVMSKLILEKMLYTDDCRVSTATGAHSEYYVIEGSKALAKINRLFILGLFSKTVHMVLDLSFIYYKDRSKGKLIFTIVVAGTVVISVLKVFQVKRTLGHLSLNSDFAYQREKQYSETMDSVYIVKSYRYEEASVDKYRAKSKLWEYTWMNYRFLTYLNEFLHSAVSSTFKLLTVICYVYFHKNSNVSDMLMVLGVTSDIIKSGTNIVKLHKDISESISLSYTVLDYLDLAREDLDRKVRVNMFNDKIEVRNVTYAARGKVIFSNINFTLNKGDKAVLYGRNGVGKSSIFKLLLNFDDSHGDILFDGMSLRKIAMVDYRSMVTFVPQDTRLFDESIYANLVFGNNRPYDEVVAECQKMRIHDKIMMLPNGYNTVVGELGKNINGGLRQKIFYTRAFLRDTPIYLFDEPTNNLDVAGSEFLLDYINDDLYRDKTVFVICHDTEIIRKFPKIFKFEESKIILEKEQ